MYILVGIFFPKQAGLITIKHLLWQVTVLLNEARGSAVNILAMLWSAEDCSPTSLTLHK